MPATRFRWVVVGMIFAITMVNYIDRSAIGYAIGDVARALHFGLHDVQLLNGLVLSAFSVGYMLTTLLGGLAADRLGARRTLFWAALLWSVAIGATGLATGFVLLVAARILLGVAEGPNFPALNRAVADWLSPHERAIALGNALVAVPLALAVGAPLVTQLITHLGWRGMFFTLAAVSILWLPLWWWLFRDDPAHSPHVDAQELAHIRPAGSARAAEAPPSTSTHGGRGGLWRFLLRDPTLLANDWAFFVFGYFLFFFMTWLPSYLGQAYGLKLSVVGWFAVLPWGCATLMLWATGYLSDALLRATGSLRIARSHPIWVTQLLAGLCLLPVIFIHRLDVALVSITLAVGLSMAANACFYAVNVDVARSRSGTALGVMDTFFAASGFIAPALTGWLVQATGHYRAAFGLLALLAASSVVVVLVFHRPDRSARSAPGALAPPEP